MSLSCDYDFDMEPGQVAFVGPHSIAPLNTKRPRKCCSCKSKIAVGDSCAEFERYKIPEYEIEVEIYGEGGDDGPPRASWFMCHTCANLFWFLEGFGYAISISDDMRSLAKEHTELVGLGQAGCL